MSYHHQQTSRAQDLAVFHVSAVPAPVTCHLSHFCLPPEPSLPTHTTATVPCQSCCAVGHGDPAHRRGTEPSNAPPIRELPVWLLAWAVLAMQTLRARGLRGKGWLALRLAGPDDCSQMWSAHRCGERSMVRLALLPHTCGVVEHLQLPVPLVALASQVLHVWLVLVNHTTRLIVNSAAAIRDEIAVPSVQLFRPKRSAASLDACWV